MVLHCGLREGSKGAEIDCNYTPRVVIDHAQTGGIFIIPRVYNKGREENVEPAIRVSLVPKAFGGRGEEKERRPGAHCLHMRLINEVAI